VHDDGGLRWPRIDEATDSNLPSRSKTAASHRSLNVTIVARLPACRNVSGKFRGILRSTD